MFDLAAVLLVIASLCAVLNERVFKLPMSIGLMVLTMLGSLAVVGLQALGVTSIYDYASVLLAKIDFNGFLMEGILSFLLFAGALHVDMGRLRQFKWVIGFLATIGVVATTFIIGFASHYVLLFLGLEVEFIYCLIFGALIAPTDPIAVLAILKESGASEGLQSKIAGESLFNDGFAVVVFLALLSVAVSGNGHVEWSHVGLLFIEEVVGGLILGGVVGYITYWLLKQTHEKGIQVLITLAAVVGGYSFAMEVHASGPLAMVVAGLFLGNHGKYQAMTESEIENLDSFWMMIDEILNAVLFALMGLEAIVLAFDVDYILAGVAMIPLALGARLFCVWVPITFMSRFKSFSPNSVKIMTWGGLRGGVSIALVLSLPESPARELLVVMTYVVVIFSVVVQGLTIKSLVSKSLA